MGVLPANFVLIIFGGERGGFCHEHPDLLCVGVPTNECETDNSGCVKIGKYPRESRCSHSFDEHMSMTSECAHRFIKLKS